MAILSMKCRLIRKLESSADIFELLAVTDYVGIGAGAHGKITDAAKQRITRTHKPKQPRDYLNFAGSPVDTKI